MKKYRKGYTTGVYDMFHIGHLNVLNNAKKHCDYLLVGVSTDELVLDYKNKKPIIPFNERKQIVENIKCVDEVVGQENMNKLLALLKYGCDVVFVGDDWKGTEKWNKYEEEFNEHGIDVVYLPYTKGTSSTTLRAVLDKVLGE
ncbi:adenylyltransferase/cytidyltransferase family protein [Thomasclavelia cocleata]|uniref:Glycerol-3-phosphate cytidylyltransferase n=1 Tax=Thomasclavelia cocleata TaxID=69824 RepID=A0A829ZA84_9FIRM|nr:adenylyltransferase/cytidyltransferase family protein [Thomasclavelia cocleata]GFI40947.1 glycerol-3-phosphate cytidylyltransferase [Thomasclavelia cocleata]